LTQLKQNRHKGQQVMAEKNKALIKAKSYDVNNLERPSGERWVTFSNALTRAGQSLTLAEKRLVMLAASKLDSYTTNREPEPPTSRVTALEYAELYELDINTAYDQLQSSAKNLYQRSITFYEPVYKRKTGQEIGQTTVKCRWVGEVKYHKQQGWVELKWWGRVTPHLLNLRKQFTSYQLKQACAFRSIYSWRLLELLMRFKQSGVAEYSIEDFCQSMDATPKQMENFNNIKRRMIEPAVKELCEKDGWIIKWEAVKAGRKVKALRFTFEKNPQMTIFEFGA